MKYFILLIAAVLLAVVWATPLDTVSPAASDKDTRLRKLARDLRSDSGESKEKQRQQTSAVPRRPVKAPVVNRNLADESKEVVRNVAKPVATKKRGSDDSREDARGSLKRSNRDTNNDSNESKENRKPIKPLSSKPRSNVGSNKVTRRPLKPAVVSKPSSSNDSREVVRKPVKPVSPKQTNLKDSNERIRG